jgi:hypothetical protein
MSALPIPAEARIRPKLLASAALARSSLWTLDRRVAAAADKIGLR